ncbi:hypothetical protein G155_00101 [Mycobacterium sp. VKM Ac-1817D]|nr:hypothetical protein G155_00101 [Mycobacterium sp. VKM Ac-1817D]
MQLGIRHRAGRAGNLGRLIAPAFTRPGRTVPAVTDGLQRQAGTARLAGKHPLHFRPARRPVVPTHPTSVSNMRSIFGRGGPSAATGPATS